MEFSVNTAFNATAEIAASGSFPNLRLATLKKVVANTPQTDDTSKANYTWTRSSPDAFAAVGGRAFSWFSATCYFFGRDLHMALGKKIPIGLVASDWGGQRVECFSSPDALADQTCGGTRPTSTVEDASKTLSTPRDELPAADTVSAVATDVAGEHNYRSADEPNPGPSQLWNAMIYPLIHMRFTGAVWYQGEANAGDPDGYACRFPAMVADWRVQFGLPELSFFYVQLAAFKANFALIRAAQDAALALPRVGVAVAIDLGDPTSPEGSIHPRRKQEVGRRLALSARAIQYGERGLVFRGPVLANVQLTAAGATIGFETGTADGLHLSGTGACSACCTVSPFEVMDSRGTWSRANASVRGQEVHLNSSAPVLGIRFDWEGYPQCALYNGAGGADQHTGLAAKPFQWCAYPNGRPAWLSSCSPHDPDDVAYPSTRIPSLALKDYSFSGDAGVAGHARTDQVCTAVNFRSGGPGGVGLVSSKHAIVSDGHTLDSVSMSFRYVAGYTPGPGRQANASTVSVQLLDAKGALLRTLFKSAPLGQYSYDDFTTFSPPIPVSASGIGLRATGKVFLMLRVDNNQRNLQIPLDDKGVGWNVSIGWA